MRGKVHEFLTLMCISLAMALIPVGFIYVLLSERACGAKHLQALSGVHPFAYWFATFAFDYIFYLLVSGAMLGVLSYKSEDFIKGDRWRLTLMMFAVFGLAIFPYLYALQNFFQNPAYGITVLLIMNIIIGMILGSVNGATKLSNQNLTALWQMVDDVGVVISPNYILSGALISMIKGDQNIRINFQTRAESAKHNQFDYLFHRDDDYLRDGMQQLLILTAISWLVVAFIDYKLYRLILYKLECLNVKVESDSYRYKEDEDVAKERKRITETNEHKLFKTDAMVMVGVSKRYCSSKTVAVYSTNLGVQEKECLGLLGQNGAGKTTMFKMLTGDIALSNGDAYFKGDSIKTKLKTVQSMMSYCPQFDALHDVLTGRETLYLYGRLRGVRDSCLKEVTNIVIDFVNLRPHEDKCTKTYSGGNKKKLSVGISIIGDPQFIMLDEPTAGMDPVSRRILWKCLHTIRSMAKTLVLTSHSMEECEALCTKIAIFKKGRMLCLGSPQHLKNKYGQGYSVVLHISEQEDGTLHPLEPAVSFVSQALGDVKVFNTQPAYCHLQVPESTLLSTLFQVLIEAKSTFFLKHFTVHQQSLEQVFLLLMKEEE
ncbi:phospholipid-transporting ATPase ABCA3-like [Physella acuta]|uniref:phospholipid-transporting ATPase ABCA3-like n=1 Tax=Physella acuta TaxID=109671 RepID=UPI0027DC3108|nr:phospholipid-transporting ATPase ABCA3-like [Physella acuta]